MTLIAETASRTPQTAVRYDATRISRSVVIGSAVAVAIAVAATSGGVVPTAAHDGLWTGVLVAICTGAIGVTILARCATIPNDDPKRAAQLYLVGLAANLGLQGVSVVVGMILFSFGDEKFAGLAAFGLTFASVAALMQVLGSVSISRFLRERAAAAAGHGTKGSSRCAPRP